MNNDPARRLSAFDVTTITFTNVGADISAIGGNFFATPPDETFTNTPSA